MTILGKLLTFLILVLSLIWNGLALNAYVTRTNWKAESDRQAKNAAASAESANKMKTLYDANQEASEDSKRVLREETYRLYDQNAKLATAQNDLNKRFKEYYEATQTANVEAKKLQQNVDKLTEENKLQREALDKYQKELDDKTKSEESAKVVANSALLSAAAEKQRAERLSERVRELSDQLEDYKRNGGKTPTPGQLTPPAPEGFRGTVTKVDAPTKTGGDYFVTFTPGGDVGLKAGAELSISRIKPPKYIGKLVVLIVDPKEAVAKFVPPPGVKPGPDDFPKINDAIVNK